MRFKAHQYLWLFVILLLLSLPLPANGNAEATARLFIRYEHGAAPNRITENVLTLMLSVASKDRSKVAIRICSKEPTPFALVTAGADPFLIADVVGGYAYPPDRVIFLRSDDCLSSADQSEPVTEIWTIPEGASLPSHVEALKSSEAKLVRLGKRPANRGVRDYRTALQKLIQNLRANPKSVGVVLGYFLERPSPMLQRRLREVTTILEQSGLSQNRYLVRPMVWNDEASTIPPDSEPRYPSVFLVKVAKGKDGARRSSVSGKRHRCRETQLGFILERHLGQRTQKPLQTGPTGISWISYRPLG